MCWYKRGCKNRNHGTRFACKGNKNMTFQLQRMATPSKDKIIADIRRVDQILNKSILTSKDYHKHSTISHGTLRKYLGSWHEALCEAGLEYKSNRKVKTKKLTEQPGKFLTDEKIIEELKHVAQKLDRDTLTTKDVDNHSTIISASTIRKRFGWKEGLGRAGLKIKPLGKRYSNEECFENLVNVWTHYGRQPKAYEMKQYPSVVGSKAYSARWGSWLEALEAFTEEINKSTVPLEEEISVQPAGEVEK